MNYYDFHIGDFNAATRHLTRIERSVYRDMIDMYYDTEKPLPLDLASLKRKLIIRSDEEVNAFDFVLTEFFIKTDGGYFNSRCDVAIQEYHSNQTAKSLAGKASAAKREQQRLARLAELNGLSTDVEQVLESVGTDIHQNPTNQKPITNNQEPETKDKKNTCEGLVENPYYWIPSLNDLNVKLKMAGAQEVNQIYLTQILVEFNPHYEKQSLSQDQRTAKLVGWIKDRQVKAKAFEAKQGPYKQKTDISQDQEMRTVDTTKPVVSSVKRGLAGIEVQEFKSLKRVKPEITEQDVIDLATAQNIEYLKAIHMLKPELEGQTS